ncbi:aminopeptidase C [uncultured Corynebacterium sp.]|uniref:aminopeptidase C n=1 Tax=uncultured Corynebacterium sp. TaxID=159447 RepID=UPI0025EF01F7|nr:C1 family peptidase [uncultured Corynebacterium sp.]
MPDFSLSTGVLAELRGATASDPALRVATNAVTSTDVDSVTLNRAAVTAVDPTTEIKLDTLGVTDQKQSGRCWMFAGLNVFRHRIAAALNVEDFEFSEVYLQFFDKLEKANRVLRRLDELFRSGVTDPDDRLVDNLLAHAADDGGQWNYLVNLIGAYGVVPREAMGETFNSGNTAQMDARLQTALRATAWAVRESVLAAGDGVSADTTATLIESGMRDIHRILATHLGLPPERLLWQYRDKDGDFHREGEFTPAEFRDRVFGLLADGPVGDPGDRSANHVTDYLAEYVCLVDDPREENPYGAAYSVAEETNMWGTADFSYINVGAGELKRIAEASLADGEPVWFACDVNRQFAAALGIWDADLYERDALYGTTTVSGPGTSKADQMRSRESMLTHGMVLTGRDAATGVWRVENSWGTKSHGEHAKLAGAGSMKGYGTMTDAWFDDNVFQIVVHRRLLGAGYPGLDALDRGETTVLPIWDAMA